MDRVLRQGMSGQDVLDWQAALDLAGCHIEASGEFDACTAARTKLFQTRNALPVSGIVDLETRAAMQDELSPA